jgi:hypothetical protein
MMACQEALGARIKTNQEPSEALKVSLGRTEVSIAKTDVKQEATEACLETKAITEQQEVLNDEMNVEMVRTLED